MVRGFGHHSLSKMVFRPRAYCCFQVIFPKPKGKIMTRLWLFLVFLSNASLNAANTLVINANVITVDKNHPSAQAFAFDNGRITAVGTNEQIPKLRTTSTEVIDLKGRTVIPGFNDAHLRPLGDFRRELTLLQSLAGRRPLGDYERPDRRAATKSRNYAPG
jgi:hypothetical protein